MKKVDHEDAQKQEIGSRKTLLTLTALHSQGALSIAEKNEICLFVALMITQQLKSKRLFLIYFLVVLWAV